MKTPFARLKELFESNWTTVFVGWRGLGIYSPWRDSLLEFPPLLSEEEILEECEKAFLSPVDDELARIIASLMEDITSSGWTRESVLVRLEGLSSHSAEEECLELRKWRVALLKSAIEKNAVLSPMDSLHEIGELWLSLGFPKDVPENIRNGYQSIDNAVEADDGARNYIELCRKWSTEETACIQSREMGK